MSIQSPRRNCAYGSHRKVVHFERHHNTFEPNALHILRKYGTELIIAEGKHVRCFHISHSAENEEICHTHFKWETHLPHPAQYLSDSDSGPVVAWHSENHTVITLIQNGELKEVQKLPGQTRSLATAADQAWLAIEDQSGANARLIHLNLAGRVLTQLPLPHADVDLQVDPLGQRLSLTDQRARTVTTRPSNLTEAMFVRNPGPAVPPPTKEPCDRCRCNPCACSCSCAPSTGGQGSPTGGTTPPGTTGGSGGTTTGGSGTPTTGGGTVTGQGGTVGSQGGDGGDPCKLQLLWQVDKLLATSQFVVAHDKNRRNLAVLSLKPFAVVEERQFNRSGFSIALDRQAPVMLLRNLDQVNRQGSYELLQLDQISKLLDPIDSIWPNFGNVDSITFEGGLHTESLMLGHASPTGPIKVLVFPFIEGGQTFNGADTSQFAAYLQRVMATTVRAYYKENSYGMLTDISFSVFGSGVGPAGAPIQLPRTHLADYFYPLYTPAKLMLTTGAVAAGSRVTFDGRESLHLAIQADGVTGTQPLNVSFAALAFQSNAALFPVIQFTPDQTLTLQVTTPWGSTPTLNLQFTTQSFSLTDDINLANELNDLCNYLDGIFHTAETAAGLNTRLFAKPVATRVSVPGESFGNLIITVNAADTSGNKLAVNQATASATADDPIGLRNALVGSIDPSTDAGRLQSYLQAMFALAEAAINHNNNDRLVSDVTASFDGGSRVLTTAIPVGDSFGGPAAAVNLVSSSGLDSLFSTSSQVANSATKLKDSQGSRDGYALMSDIWTSAVKRVQAAGQDPRVVLGDWNAAMAFPMDQAVHVDTDPDSVQPSEMWKVTPLFVPPNFTFRGFEGMWTVHDLDDQSIQLQAVWTCDFFSAHKPDSPMICHEIGHGIGFRDLYPNPGYRQDLVYIGEYSVMCNHPRAPHHCGYHKMEAGWITPDRITNVAVANPGETNTLEALLVPVELWDPNLVNQSRTVFGVDSTIPVLQLIQLDLGGDDGMYDLIEARQKGAQFSQSLPVQPGIIITNAVSFYDDQRYSFNGDYRQELQWLNPNNILQKKGDKFDLAKAAGLPAKGIVVEVLDALPVGAANVFHIKVTRVNSDYVDLYFTGGNPYYKSPDLYVDWAGDNGSTDPAAHHQYPPGQPTDQGEQVRVPKKGTELHWIVGRIRNRGGVKAESVKLDFKMCSPPGGGDRSGNFQLMGSVVLPEVAGGDVPTDAVFRWDVPAGFSGHTCLAVEVADYKIPVDSDGAALATDDVWLTNNHCQKNVDQFIPASGSPYDPVEFDYSVHNDAAWPEFAYLEPDGLPEGMKLTVWPREQSVPAKSTVIFHCKLELDDKVIDAGCRSDRQFQLTTWRRERESTTRWGGVQYKIKPRKKCAVNIAGVWFSDGTVQLSGSTTPDVGGGVLRLRLAFSGADYFWVTLDLGAGSAYFWKGPAVGDGQTLEASAWFEGNLLYSPCESDNLTLQPPPPIK